jgi:hypothetical protein
LYGNRLVDWEVDGTGSASCPVPGFDISDIKPLGITTRELVKNRKAEISNTNISPVLCLPLLSTDHPHVRLPYIMNH